MNSIRTKYAQLKKPRWAPPANVFGPVWAVLYILIVLSYGTVLYWVARGELSTSLVLPIVLNVIFNLAYAPLQFRLRNNYLALLDIVLIIASLVISMRVIYVYMHWPVYLLVPYLAWVCVALALQSSITWLNR